MYYSKICKIILLKKKVNKMCLLTTGYIWKTLVFKKVVFSPTIYHHKNNSNIIFYLPNTLGFLQKVFEENVFQI